MMTELERRFMALGCAFFSSQVRDESDFIEVHVCADYLTDDSYAILINKRAIIAVSPSDSSNLGGAARSKIRIEHDFYLVTETYEQLKDKLL